MYVSPTILSFVTFALKFGRFPLHISILPLQALFLLSSDFYRLPYIFLRSSNQLAKWKFILQVARSCWFDGGKIDDFITMN